MVTGLGFFIAFVLMLALLALLAFAGDRIVRLQEQVDNLARQKHTECVDRISSAASTKFAAETLRSAARDWDNPREQANLQRLARERYSPGGPSMPIIWLNDRADRMDPRETVQKNPRDKCLDPKNRGNHDHRFDGSCIYVD